MAKIVVNLSIIVGDEVAQSTHVVDAAALSSQNWTAAVLQLALTAALTPPPPVDRGPEWPTWGGTHAKYDASGGEGEQ